MEQLVQFISDVSLSVSLPVCVILKTGLELLYSSPQSYDFLLYTHFYFATLFAGMLSLDTSPGSLKTRQLTKHSGATATYLSDAFLIKAGGVVQAVQATDGSIRSAGPPTHHQLICGDDPSHEVTRG